MREEEVALQAYSDGFFRHGDTDLPYSVIAGCPNPSWIVRRFTEQFGADSSIASEINRSISSCPFQPGKTWYVAGGILVTDRDALRYVADNPSISYALDDNVFELSESVSEEIRRNRGNEVLWLPYDAGQCDVRMPRQGDRMAPLGMRGTRLVSDVLKESGLDSRRRREVPVVVRRTDGEILWIPGVKRSRHDIIDSSAHEVHLITIRRES